MSSIHFPIDGDACVNLTIGAEIYSVETPPYEGAYEAGALFQNQVFQTRNKRMVNNFTVRAINYTEAQNDAGGVTVTIGG